MEEKLKETILSSQEASQDIAQFKESIKAVEDQTKARQENLLNALAAALEENNQRPLRTKDNAYVYLKRKTADLTVIPVRMAAICEGVTDAKLLEISKKINSETGTMPTLLDAVFVAIQEQVEEVCCPKSETVAVCSRRPGNFGNVEAKDASPQVEKQVAQYLQLHQQLGVVRDQKKKGVEAFKAKAKQTSSALMQMVGAAMKDGNVPSVNMRFVPAPPSQKSVQVLKGDDIASSQEQAAVLAVEGLPKVPASLEAFVPHEEEEEEEEEEEAGEEKAESIVLVPGLPSTVTMHLKLADIDPAAAAEAAAKKAESKTVMPKSSEFISSLTKESVYKCIQPVLIASGTKKDAVHTYITKPVTQELLHQVWTNDTRKEFTQAMLKLHESISAQIKGVREHEKAKKAAEKKTTTTKSTTTTEKKPAAKRAKKTTT